MEHYQNGTTIDIINFTKQRAYRKIGSFIMQKKEEVMIEEFEKEICSNCKNKECSHHIEEYIEDNMFRAVCKEYKNKKPAKRNKRLIQIMRQ